MGLTAAHWVYLAGIVLILGTTIVRRNVVVPALLATIATAATLTGDPIVAVQAVFNATLTAASELFNIFLIIAMVTALLGTLRAMNADQRMVTPFQKVMRGGWSAWLVLIVATYGISLFFWPTPAVPLIGAILVPAAIRAGLPAMGAAMAIAVAGQGMALSSDYVMQVAPGLSATAAGADAGRVADVALVLALVTGAVALAIMGVMLRREMRIPSAALLEAWENGVVSGPRPAVGLLRRLRARLTGPAPVPVPGDVDERVVVGATTGGPPHHGAGGPGATPPPTGGGGGDGGGGDAGAGGAGDERTAAPRTERLARFFAVAVPVAFGLMMVYLVLGGLGYVPSVKEGSAAALVGGLATVLVVIACVALDGPKEALTSVGNHVTDGLVFAFRAMGIVLPIAGFFFIGNESFAGEILGLEDGGPQAPALLVDLVVAAEHHIPGNPVVMCFGVLFIGLLCGLEGSGFSGLPLTGSLAGALGPSVGMDPATLAAVGQMGSVWAGGGVLVAWSSLLVVAGVTRVPVIELARRCFLPVMAGLAVSTLVAAFFF
ncbi:hypothetical protein [Pseudonocardia sp. HH130630-07]|uniref:hypothetical protein n=1 Tax=Pseudonocardia sp. HH130630-07 TaxID=1690815 RepID=UPI000815225C|nr:hypothetical protein [Pseudonocardia sp. HH130630-07]ANY08823.1 hypothetical protein AFB00_24040 [Pseudonocardia sp. HH130630-07]